MVKSLDGPSQAGFGHRCGRGCSWGQLAHHFLVFLVELFPSAQLLWGFTALAAVAAAVADEVAAAGAAAGAEARGVELAGAQLETQRIGQMPDDGSPLMLDA